MKTAREIIETKTITDGRPDVIQKRPIHKITASREWRDRVIGLDESCHSEVAKMAAEVEYWTKACCRNLPTGKMIVVAGETGVGKSHAIRAAIRFIRNNAVDLWSRGWWGDTVPSVVDVNWSELSQMTRGDRKLEDSWREAIEADICYAEDVGTETDAYKSGQPIENLRLFLEERRHKRTAITTNKAPSVWAEVWNDRVEDRLYRGSIIVTMPTVASYPKSKRSNVR